jgi:hypothetical protein
MTQDYDPYPFKEPNLAATDVKRQHYVPQRYLKQFAIGERIDVLEVEGGGRFTTSVANVAVESYYYDLRYEQEKLSTEAWFAREIEEPFWPLMDRLRSTPATMLDLTEDEQTVVARYLAAQRLRVPNRREYIERTRAKFREWAAGLVSNARGRKIEVEQLDEHLADNPTIPWLRSDRAYQFGEAMSTELGEVTGDARVLMAKPWRIGRTDERFPLYTSDNPVSTHVPPVLPDFWDDLWDTNQYFPIAPDTLLVIAAIPPADGRKIAWFGDRRCSTFNRWETSRARSLVTCEASTYVYGAGACPLSRKVARRNVTAFDEVSRAAAIKWSGYDPSKPQSIPQQVLKLVDPRFPSL